MDPQAVIWTEGKTDWQHIQRAFSALNVGPRIEFHREETDFGDDQLLKQCAALARVMQACPNIFIFDHDNDQILSKIDDSVRGYKSWGNNVYSFAIPIPSHRKDEAGVCIELYYTDDELRMPDTAGRRLFLSTEFSPVSGRVQANTALSIGNKGRLPIGKNAPIRIIDSEVYDERGQNVALSKADFARNVLEGKDAFANFHFEAFRAILALVNKIIEDQSTGIDLPFGELVSFLRSLDELDTPHQLAALVDGAIRVCKLGAMVFIAAAIRHYEAQITDPVGGDRKVRPIKQILLDSFGNPSLSTLQKLARHCYHLIDEHAPSELAILRSVMAETPTLGLLGDMLDQLEQVLPPVRSQVRTRNKRDLKKPVLDYVIPELAKYEGRISEITETVSASGALRGEADPGTWYAALVMLVRIFSPLRQITFRIRSVERVHSNTDDFGVLLSTYRDGQLTLEEMTQKYEDMADDRLESYELLCIDGESIVPLDLFPFLTIKDNRLHYYSRTRPQGYEYVPTFGRSGHMWPTKRKFSKVALRSTSVSDLQGLFWTQSAPIVSDIGVKANIPVHEPIVGRKQQIGDVISDIVQIPNQNGIIYGPGGVGKTALLIELSWQLFSAPPQGVYFNNIIWVSAKCDSHDPTLDATEPRVPQFQSMDNVLDAILTFHGMEDATGYERNDKKWLVIESLRDEKSLLVLDNLETVPRVAQNEIIRFFGLEVKRALRDKPDYFKVLITSRELIPSGFHQMELKGLDKRESKELMERLYEPYARSGRKQLTGEQMEALYEVTRGIPLIIKHCYGQFYEFNRSIDTVLKGLSSAGNKVVDFSFAEIFQILKQDELELKTILVLELSGRPVMARQVADILGLPEPVITERLTPLVRFQCVTRSSTGLEEKYSVNNDLRFFTRRLTLEYADLARDIKRLVANLPIEKRMDYSQEEADAILMFQEYVTQGHHVMAEEFMRERLEARPDSVFLNLHYAKYLKEVKQQTEEAIERLEVIRQRSGNDLQILRLLMAYYIALPVPNFEQAHSYARELEACASDNPQIKLELARFYVAWSTAIKMMFDLDPNKEMLRQQKYKECADVAVKHLESIHERTWEWHYLMAQGCYNRWDYDPALRHIDKAIERLPKPSHLALPYQRFRGEILKKRAHFTRKAYSGE
jgi:tetratricopeptide (TPR) repeat protein